MDNLELFLERVERFIELIKEDLQIISENARERKIRRKEFFDKVSDKFDREIQFRILIIFCCLVIIPIIGSGAAGVIVLFTLAYPECVFAYLYISMLALGYVLWKK